MTPQSAKKAAIIGGGVIGGGWAARLVLNGIDVVVSDPDPQAERKIGEVMALADRAFAKLTNAPQTRRGALTFAKSVAEAVEGADFIQESAPERLELKQKLLAEIDRHAPSRRADRLVDVGPPADRAAGARCGIRSGSSSRIPSTRSTCCRWSRSSAGRKRLPETIERAKSFYAGIGMKPLHVRKEIEAFIGDRLLEAFWREALWLVHDDVATAEEIDDVVRYSFGLRWAQMGTFMVYRIAGGEPGMRHFMNQFGPALKWPWTKLMDVPDFTPALVDKIVAQSDAQAGDLSIRELERIRDDNLVAIMQALRAQNDGKGWGAGALLKEYEDRLFLAGAWRDGGARPRSVEAAKTLRDARLAGMDRL